MNEKCSKSNKFIFIARFLQTISIGGLVSYFVANQTEITHRDAYWYAAGISLSLLFHIIAYHPFRIWIYCMATKYRLACAGLIYEKSLTLSKLSINEGMSGKVLTILANDLSRLEPGLVSFLDVYKGPLETMIFGYLIYAEAGFAGFVGVLFLVAFVPIQG